MFGKVLVALDFSKHSQNILDHVLEIPGIQEVVLLHVIDASHPSRHGWTYGPEIENAKIILAEKKEALVHAGLKAHVLVDVLVDTITQGNVSTAILETAEAKQVSLIIVGARGTNPIKELLLGSVSSTVLRRAGTSVLILPGVSEQVDSDSPGSFSRQEIFSKLLVPTDFSEPAREAFLMMKKIPGIREIVLLNVVTRAESQLEIEASVTEAQSLLEEMKREISAGITIRIHVRVGDPAGMIESVAREEEVSLIGMSAHGTDFLYEILLGSTTFSVLRRTKKPVMVIRDRKQNESSQNG
jgi:nucleotide-binding universal stress UspA family protein